MLSAYCFPCATQLQWLPGRQRDRERVFGAVVHLGRTVRPKSEHRGISPRIYRLRATESAKKQQRPMTVLTVVPTVKKAARTADHGTR